MHSTLKSFSSRLTSNGLQLLWDCNLCTVQKHLFVCTKKHSMLLQDLVIILNIRECLSNIWSQAWRWSIMPKAESAWLGGLQVISIFKRDYKCLAVEATLKRKGGGEHSTNTKALLKSTICNNRSKPIGSWSLSIPFRFWICKTEDWYCQGVWILNACLHSARGISRARFPCIC